MRKVIHSFHSFFHRAKPQNTPVEICRIHNLPMFSKQIRVVYAGFQVLHKMFMQNFHAKPILRQKVRKKFFFRTFFHRASPNMDLVA